MTKYRVTYDVLKATGFQSYTIEADTPEQAETLVRKGGGEFEAEEVEVYELSPTATVEEC